MGQRVDGVGKTEPDESETVARLRGEVQLLRAAVRARDDFISVAAHELRNPLTPLVAQVDLLRKAAERARGELPAPVAAAIGRLDFIVRRYLKRTTALLDISRLSSGNFRLDVGPVDVSAVIGETAADFALHAHSAGSALTTRIDAGVKGLLDRTAVEEIAENLLSNAIKYGRGRPIELRLTGEPGAAVLEVRDHGDGICPTDQARIFERFERLVTGRSAVGFGLGLWVVGQLTHAMGGSVAVASRVGEGTTFTVRLPFQEPGAT